MGNGDSEKMVGHMNYLVKVFSSQGGRDRELEGYEVGVLEWNA